MKIKINFIPLAMFILKRALKDDSYYFGWKANIAMAFYDKCQELFEDDEDRVQLKKLANASAEYFLDLLIKERKGGERK